ncbi:hypothetical protein T06_16731 [Trichinella sp. T6]|nr:hypothetical protein T06_16731 [Trichinella sp. T6]
MQTDFQFSSVQFTVYNVQWCNDPLGGVVWFASSGSTPVRPLSLLAGSSSLARSRLRVAIFHVRIVRALALHARPLTNSLTHSLPEGLRRSNI